MFIMTFPELCTYKDVNITLQYDFSILCPKHNYHSLTLLVEGRIETVSAVI